MSIYYLHHGGETKGPLSDAQALALHRESPLKPGTPASKDGQPWVPVANLFPEWFEEKEAVSVEQPGAGGTAQAQAVAKHTGAAPVASEAPIRPKPPLEARGPATAIPEHPVGSLPAADGADGADGVSAAKLPEMGLGRRTFALCFFGILLAAAGITWAASIPLASTAILPPLLLTGLAMMIPVTGRLRNIGDHPIWAGLSILPIANLYVFGRCLALPPNFEYEGGKLDRTAKIVFGLLALPVAVILVYAMMNREPIPDEFKAATGEPGERLEPGRGAGQEKAKGTGEEKGQETPLPPEH